MNSFRAPSRFSRGILLALAVAALCSPLTGGRAADPQPYKVTIAQTGDATLDGAVHDSSTLISLHDSAPVGPFALVARARADMDRFLAALHSFGHYDGSVAITIAGRPLGDPDLPAALADLPAGSQADVAVQLTPGPLFHLRQITVTGDAPAEARAKLGLTSGAPALAADVLAAHDRLLAALRDSGHALARVDQPVATLAPAAQALDVSFAVQAGPRVDLGQISIEGLHRTHEAFVRKRLLLHSGERFDPRAIEKAREDLAGVGVFSAVRIDPAAALDTDGRLPVQVAVTERMLRTVNLGAAYSTDLGGSLSASWTHHNLFGNAETLTLSAAATELGGTAARQPGYNISALLTLPDWGHRDQSLSFNAAAIKEYLDAYNRNAYLAGATLSRRIDPDLTLSVGLQAEQAHIVQESEAHDYTLLQVPVSASYDTTHMSLDPTRGLRASISLTPSESFSTRNATFVIAQASGSAYLDLGTRGRSVLAVRGLVGGVEGATTFDIPPDQRFYAGGGGTVRGYRFQSIGPHFADRRPVGGTAVDVGSIEFRQRFGSSYGAVAFVDAGQVGTSGVPFEGNLDVGAGVGARYYTSFGPIRVDIAVPLTKQTGNDSLEVYLGIGQAF
jgi:translocation and assembly module TamA